MDGLQLAYKVTANSVYGQMGAKTSSIFFKKLLHVQLQLVDKGFMMLNMVLLNGQIFNGYNKPEVVYGDTDSVFIKVFKDNHESGKELKVKKHFNIVLIVV